GVACRSHPPIPGIRSPIPRREAGVPGTGRLARRAVRFV
ncbi:MAG: hypothetical protein AVDCRST_MAG28-1239, partial [uncultured Rubrobacteraceae bacterium]